MFLHVVNIKEPYEMSCFPRVFANHTCACVKLVSWSHMKGCYESV